MLPLVTLAQSVQITEIMYDPEGSDTDYEWLEIHNTSGSSVDLDEWAFYENETNHGINDAGDGLTLASDGRAVIARNVDGFSSRYSSFSALLTESVFSLVNGGESIALTNPAGDVVGEVPYDPDTGAGGDGNSLQLSDNGWIAANPTPGETNATEATDGNDDSSSDSDYAIHIMDPRPEPNDSVDNITIDAGGVVPALAGLEVDIIGQVSGIDEHELDSLDFHWSLGNGDTATDLETSYTYEYPGTYVATLHVTTDEGDTRTDATTIEVMEPAVIISEVGQGGDAYIQLKNDTGRSVDLTGWSLSDGSDVFTFPAHTIHLDNEQLIITADISGLSSKDMQLRYPDGRVADSYTQPEEESSIANMQTTQTSRTYTPSADTNASGQSADNTGDDTGGEGEVQGTSTSATDTDRSVSLDDTFATGSQAAAALMATRQSGNTDTLWQWAGMLILLLLITVGTAILLRRVSKPADSPLVQASKFDINQIGENSDGNKED